MAFRLKENYDRHMATAHNPAWMESQITKKRKIVPVPDMSNFTLGFTKSKAKMYPCPECHKVYRSEGELEGHIERDHPKARPWPVQRRSDSSGPYAPIGMF